MTTAGLFENDRGVKVWIALAISLALIVASVLVAFEVQRDFGAIEVTNDLFSNESGVTVRAKLFRPLHASSAHRVPGVVFIPGYQSTRESGDGISIELARRGFAVLEIDAIGRGNSGNPGFDVTSPAFDSTFGAKSALAHLKSLPFVDSETVGMIGHSLGGEMAFNVALEDSTVKALVVVGYAYTTAATPNIPKNMLMIFGRYDEFRDRMTGTRNFESEWMVSEQTKRAFAVGSPRIGEMYGSFENGTARKVAMPTAIHIGETHSKIAIAESLEWMRSALNPDSQRWIDPKKQIWPIKEWATLFAMFACFSSIIPLALILLRTRAFASLQGTGRWKRVCSNAEYLKHVGINGLLMWLYLPLVMVLFAIHKYVVPVDRYFPMMVVNGTVWWLIWINVIGFFLFLRWYRKLHRSTGIGLAALGISFAKDRLFLDRKEFGKTTILAAILVVFTYGLEHILETLFIVDFRFIFAFASDLTAYRALMFLLYYPPLLIIFLQTGFFLHVQILRAPKRGWASTLTSWTTWNLVALATPLFVLLIFQYAPLFATGAIPFVGPGGMFVLFVINIFHILGVIAVVVPISTWLFQLTGRPYLGALVCAGIVCWMFTSSQVIAPVPI